MAAGGSDLFNIVFIALSSQFSFQIMQTFYPDAYNRFKSLDDIYYYGGQNAHNVISVLPHSPASHNQIQVKTGDLIGIAGNHWDGYSKGKNLRTNVSAPLVTLSPAGRLSDRKRF